MKNQFPNVILTAVLFALFVVAGQPVTADLGPVPTPEMLQRWKREREQEKQQFLQAAVEPTVIELKGHTKGVYYAAFSPEGNMIATSGSFDKTIRIWDANSGKQLQLLEGHEGRVDFVSFSPDGKKIVSAGLMDEDVRIWDLDSGKTLKSLTGHKSKVKSASFSPDGKKIITAGGDNTVRIWNTDSGEELQKMEGLGMKGYKGDRIPFREIYFAVFSPDGKKFAVNGTHGWSVSGRSEGTNVLICDADSGEVLLEMEGESETDTHFVAFSPDGKNIVKGRMGNSVRIWDVNSGKSLQELGGWHRGEVRSAMFSGDGKKIITSSEDSTVIIWDANSGKELQRIRSPSGKSLYHAAFSPDGKKIVVADGTTTPQIWTELSEVGIVVDLSDTDKERGSTLLYFTVLGFVGLAFVLLRRDRKARA